MKVEDRIKGGMFGVAVGDAYGCTYEFMDSHEIHLHDDIIGGGVFDFAPGEVTDDTDMTLCVARGIIANPTDPMEAVGKEFMAWYHSNPKDIGASTRQVLSYYDRMEEPDWHEAAKTITRVTNGRTAGNGALMRTLPVPLVYKDNADMLLKTKYIGAMTHFNDFSTKACMLYNAIVSLILNNGKDLKQAIEDMVGNIPFDQQYKIILDKDKFLQLQNCEPDGFVLNTLRWVLYTAYHYGDDFETAIKFIVQAGSDTDTTAAILGGLLGVAHGYDAIPQRWVDKLLIKNELEGVVNELIRVRG